jgi:stage IV sporulation protein A
VEEGYMNNVIRDVVFRTNGEMYIGVVGSVRSGKSMFIRKFIQTKVLPYVESEDLKHKIIDELPQSAEGKAIMTVEPKFVPSTPVQITVEENLKLNIRLVDCVGYIIESAKGYNNEDGTPRLVRTPWFSDNIAFEEAATIGTQKVISNHSHIGILMTSDGSFGEFKRHEYEKVETNLVNELKSLNKPFVIVLNTAEPNSNATNKLISDLETKYNVTVVAVNVMDLNERDIDKILNESLNEFDISKLDIKVPTWMSALEEDNQKKKMFNDAISTVTGEYRKFKDVKNIKDKLSECELFSRVEISNVDSGTGEVEITIDCKEEVYDEILGDILGEAIDDKGQFLTLLQDFVKAKREYDKLASAIEMVKATGYGIANPDVLDMELKTPEVIKQGSRYGIKLRAIAPSIHMIKVEVESSFEPIIGTEEQSKKLIGKMMEDYDKNPNAMWNSEIFGRKLSEVVNDGIKAKLYLIPENVQSKVREALEKIVNKGKGGILAIIL